MKVSKERKRKAMARKMINCIADGKYKPSNKAVEEFKRPVYGMKEKKDGSD